MSFTRDQVAGSLGQAGALMLVVGVVSPIYGTAGMTWQSASPATVLGIGALGLAVYIILTTKPQP